MSERDNSKTIMAFLFGGAIGACLVSLFALQARKTPGKKFKIYFNSIGGKTGELIAEGRDKIKKLAHHSKTAVKDNKGERMSNVPLKSLVMLAVLIGLADVSSVHSSSKVFSIGPRATYSKPADADSGTYSGGAQVRFGITPSLKLEGSIDYRRDEFTKYIKIHVYPVQASVMAYLIPNKYINPFLLGGVGWYYTQIEGPLNFSYTSNRFGFHAGAGLEIMLSGTLSLDGSYRKIWVAELSSKDVTAFNKDYKDSGYMITTGLNFLF